MGTIMDGYEDTYSSWIPFFDSCQIEEFRSGTVPETEQNRGVGEREASGKPHPKAPQK
jgi:hypothetical protein